MNPIQLSIAALFSFCIVQFTCGEVIDLPLGVRAEGVAHVAGSNFLVSDAFTGNLYLLDTSSKLITTAVRAPPARSSLGVYATSKYFFSAGGGATLGVQIVPPPVASLYIYDVVSGLPKISCSFTDGVFVNDVWANDRFAYYTDSGRAVLYRVSLTNDFSSCEKDVSLLSLNEDFVVRGFNFAANGIRGYRNGLIIANGAQATIYFKDLLRNGTMHKIVPTGSIPNLDGLETAYDKNLQSQVLYISQNQIEVISVWKLSMGTDRIVTAVKIKDIRRPKQFKTQTTVAVGSGRLLAANFDFRSPFVVPPNETHSVVFIPLNNL